MTASLDDIVRLKQIHLSDHSFTITVKPAPTFIRIFLLLFLILFAGIPFLIITLVFKSASGPQFGMFIALGVMGLIGFYFLRLILWNSYGTERYTIQQDTIDYVADYKWFKDGKKQFQREGLLIGIEQPYYEDENWGKLTLSDGTTKMVSAVKTDMDDLKILLEWLHEYVR